MARRPGSRVVRLFAIVLPLLTLGLAGAAPGDLDPMFGSGGVATFDASGAGSFELATALVILPSGRIVVAVNTTECALLGLTSGGVLDPGFGTGGKAVIPSDHCGGITALALQPDGTGGVKIIVVLGVDFELSVARYDVNGNLDSSFGTLGIAHTAFTGGQFTPTSVAVQTDDALADFRKIVVAGFFVAVPGPSTSDIALARFDADGGPDSGFDGDGQVLVDLGADEQIYAVALQGDKIVVGGGKGPVDPGQSQEFLVGRFTTGGALDNDVVSGFGADGWVTTNFNDLLPAGTDHGGGVRGLVVQAGKIVAVGVFETQLGGGSNTDTPALARYNDDGSLDASFGNTSPGPDGRTVGPDGSAAQAAVLQPDGKIVVSGFFEASGAALFGVARYSADGVLDGTFGAGGVATTDFTGPPVDPSTDFSNAVAVAIQSDGKIVAVGVASQDPVNDPEDLDTRVVRYRVDSADTTPPTINSASVSPAVLWPPFHQMVPVTVTVNATDDVGPVTCAITQIQSNQPVNGFLDGNTAPDWQITGALTANLRAERALLQGRRVYTLTVRCEDGAGNAATTQVRVIVPVLPPWLFR